MSTLRGRSVAVLGASRGIGAAIATACACAGSARLDLVGRDAAALAEVAAGVSDVATPATAVAVHRCDVTDVAAVRALVDALPALDVLVVNAGTNRPGPFLDVEEDTFDTIMSLNVRAAFFAAQAGARRMRRDGTAGAIIMMSSQMGHVGAPLRSVYCASKHAVEGMVKALGVELAPHGIRVVSVAPTFVRTALTAGQLDDPEVGGGLLAQIPLGRWGTPEEVGAAVAFAASGAAGLMTGTSLRLDGGWTAR
jgi:NAD(P)-dependent dehydrogenase (short-subunit alcohol dehydrogenase family)